MSSPALPLAPPGEKRIAIQGVVPGDIVALLPEVRIEEARRIVSHVYRGGRLGEPVATVRRISIEAVGSRYEVRTLDVVATHRSALDPFIKLVFETADEKRIEAVRIPLEKQGRYTACVSSQVGCGLACAFCATGRMGLRRNLESWEIVEQVRAIRATIAAGEGRVHGVVFQGMGEAMANLERVLQAIAVMTDPSALAIDQRTFTVSTSGLPIGIRRLAREAPKVRLALSIGSARADVRKTIMPIEDAHPLDEVIVASVEHAQTTQLSPLWAFTLLRDVNDTDDDGHALGRLARDFTERSGHRPRVTFIPYNPIDEGAADPFERSTPEREDALREVLRNYGVFPHRRYSGGADVDAACGQLAARS